MKSINWFKSENYSGNLGITATGGAATAFVNDNVITINFVNTATTASYVIDTPFAFKVVDSYSVANAAATGAVVYVDNATVHITSDLGGATDTLVTRTTVGVNSAQEFANGDNDLTVSASATATDAPAIHTIYLTIEPV